MVANVEEGRVRRVYSPSQLGFARRFIDRCGADVRYCYVRGRWLVWDGRRWEYDDGSRIELLIKQTIDAVIRDAAEAESDDARKKLLTFALKMEKRAELRSALELARSEPGIPVRIDELDSDPWLFNVENGTLDLRNGEFRDHRRGDLITCVCDVDYQPKAKAPRWRKFLEEVLPDAEVRRFVQKAVGYSLTGDTREHIFFVCHGSGANGKSVFFETLLRLLGDLATKCPSDTLAKFRSTSIPNDMARLQGKRLAAAVELEEGFQLAEARIKEIVGGDTISARYMRGEWFDFRPACKLWVASNYRPKIKGSDDGIWRRVRLIPFEVTIEKPDRELASKLAAELPGILLWALEGCRMWRAEGLEPPSKVAEATGGYRSAEDLIGRFVDDECVLDPKQRVSKSALYDGLVRWCDDAGEDPPTKRALGSRMVDLGLSETRSSKNRVWLGIALKAPEGFVPGSTIEQP